MYILIPLLLSAICSFVNPYVGLFAIFTIVELIIVFCVDINANARVRLSLKPSVRNISNPERLRKSGKALVTAECALVVFFTIIITIAECGVWMLASGSITGDAAVMTPVPLEAGKDLTVSCVLLIFGILLQIIALILAFVRRGQLLRRLQEV